VVAAGGVEPGDPVLLVRGRSQWQVDGLIDQDVMRVDTVTRRPHPVDVGCHAPIDDDRAPLVHSDARVAGQIGRRSHTDGDQDDIAGNVQVWRDHDAQRTVSLLLDAFHRLTARQVDAVATQLFADDLAEVGIEGGQHCGCHLHHRHLETASVSASAVSMPT
jgi:hypothetical protein